MPTLVGGEGLGLFNTSQLAGFGRPQAGSGTDRVYVNTVTGNLVVQAQDEFVSATGLDLTLLRTYNSLGRFLDDNGDNWQVALTRRLVIGGGQNPITRIAGDGHEALFSFNATLGYWRSTAGEGAHDLIRAAGANWEYVAGGTGVTETYDSSGRLVSVRDSDGNTLTYSYTGSLLTQVQDASGQITYLDYTGNNLTQIRVVGLVPGATSSTQKQTLIRVRYAYDGMNRLTQVQTDLTLGTDNSTSDGKVYVTTYTYDGASKRIASISQSDGSQLRIAYVQVGDDFRVESLTTVVGAGQPERVLSFNYDLAASRTDVRDTLGHVSRQYYDGSKRLIRVESPSVEGARAAVVYGYDADGNLASVTDAAGRATTYGYDSRGNLVESRDAGGNTVRRTFNGNDQVVTETVYLTPDPDGAGSGQPSNPLTTRYVYDAEQHLRFSISPEGRVTEHRYDTPGNRVATIVYTADYYNTTGLSETQAPAVTTMESWVTGRDKTKTSRVDYTPDLTGQVKATTRYTAVDSAGNGVNNGEQSTTLSVYSLSGELLQTTDPRGYSSVYTYDGLGRMSTARDAANRTTTTVYDDAANTIRVTAAHGLVTTSVYNKSGELVSQTHTAGNGSALGTTTYFYDAAGRLRMVVDPTGAKSHSLYDGHGWKIADISAEGELTEYVYNLAGQLIRTLRYDLEISESQLVNADGTPKAVSLHELRGGSPVANGVPPTLDLDLDNSTATGNSYRTTAKSGQVVAAVDGDLALSDGGDNSGRLAGATALITNVKDGASETLAVNTNGTNIQWSYNNGLLTLWGDDTVANYQAVLRSLKYCDARTVGITLGDRVIDIAVRDTTESSWVARSTITVVNTPPVASNDTYTTSRNVGLSVPTASGVLVNDSDVEGSALTAVRLSGPSRGTLTLNANGSFTYTPFANTFGTDTFTYQISDGSALSNVATVTINVAENAAPLAASDTYSVNEDAQLVRSAPGVLSNDSDPNGDSLTAVIVSNPSKGTVTLNPNGSFTYIPFQHINGQDSFTYQARDGGGLASSPATVTININPVNDRPVLDLDASGYGTGFTSNASSDGTAVRVVDADLSITDVDDTHLESARAEFTTNVTALETLSVSTAGTPITASYDAVNGVLTLTGHATVAQYRDVLSTLSYSSALAPTQTADHKVNVYVNDGSVDSTVAVATIKKPVLGAPSTGPALQQVQDAIADAQQQVGALVSQVLALVPDPGSISTQDILDQLAALQAMVQGILDGLPVPDTDPIVDQAITTVLGLAGQVLGAVAGLQAEINRIIADDPPQPILSMLIQSAFNAVKMAPLLDLDGNDSNTPGADYRRSFSFSQSSVSLVDSDLRIFANGTTLQGARIVLNGTKPAWSYDPVLSVAAPNGINVFYQPSTLTLQLSGEAPIASYEAALRTLRFASGVESPSLSSGVMRFEVTVTDYSGETSNVATSYLFYGLAGSAGVGAPLSLSRSATTSTFGMSYLRPSGEAMATSANAPGTSARVLDRLYDTAGRLVYLIDESGFATKYEYDGAGRKTAEVAYNSPVSVPGSGRAEDLVITPDAANDRRTRFFYGSDGLLRGTLDSAGYLSEKVYDGAGRLTKTVAYATATNASLRQSGTLDQLRPSAASGDQVSHCFYDGQGRKIGYLDGEGHLTVNEYDKSGNKTRETRYQTPVSYTSQDLITLKSQATGPEDQVQTWEYDSLNRLYRYTDHQGTLTQYEYDALSGFLIKTTKALGQADSLGRDDQRVSSVRYDDLGRVVQVLGGAGSAQQPALGEAAWTQYAIRHEYDAAGRRVRTIDANGRATVYFYDRQSRLRYSVNGEGEVAEFRYNAFGEVEKTIQHAVKLNPVGLTGGLVENGYIAALLNDPGERTTTTTYTARGQVDVVTDALGFTTDFTYNAFKQAIAKTFDVGAGPGSSLRTDTSAYDSRGLLTTAIEDAGGKNKTSRVLQYDAFGRAVQTQDPNGNLRSATYDRIGRVVAATDASGTALTTYDAFSRVLTQTDRLGKTTSFNYDDSSQALTITTPELIVTTRKQNRHGQEISVSLNNNGVPETTTYSYDKDGRLVQSSDPNGFVASSEYDKAGLLTVSVDRNGIRTSYSYDAANRVLVRIVDPGTGTNAVTGQAYLNLRTEFAYSSFGEAVRVTDGEGVVTETVFDAKGRGVAVITDATDRPGQPPALKLATVYSYDARGNRLTVREGVQAAGSIGNWNTSGAAQKVTAYTYDKLGRRESETLDPGALGITTLYGYDSNGNAVRKTDANGKVWRYLHDAMDRIAYTVDPLGHVTKTEYDAEGRITAIARYASPINPAVLTDASRPGDVVVPPAQGLDQVRRIAYDKDGRAVFEVDALNFVTERQFDAGGRVTQEIRYANALAAGVPATTADIAAQRSNLGASRVKRYVYDAGGRRRFDINELNQVTETRYDAAGRVTEAVRYLAAATLPSGSLTISQVAVTEDPQDQHTFTVYDAAGRVTSVTDAAGFTESYGYDRVGNRISLTNKIGNERPADAAWVAAHTWTYEYDGAGRLIREISPTVTTSTVSEVIADGLSGASSVEISPDGQYVYVGGVNDDSIGIFRREAGGHLVYVDTFRYIHPHGYNVTADVYDMHVSKDGQHLYVLASFNNALTVLSRGSDGRLSFVESHRDGFAGVDGLALAMNLAASPDGAYLYVTGMSDGSVSTFARGADGRLTYLQTLKDGVGGVDGLYGADGVAVSADGKHVYVAGGDDNALAVFSRGADGRLTFIQVLRDGVSGVDGLNDPTELTMSPDGKYVYVLGRGDNSVAVFARNTTVGPTFGQLTFVQVLKDGVNGVDGLDGPLSIAASPDGTAIFVASFRDNSIATFKRNSDGTLSYVSILRDGQLGVDGIGGADALAFSPDSSQLFVASPGDNAVALIRHFGNGQVAFMGARKDGERHFRSDSSSGALVTELSYDRLGNVTQRREGVGSSAERATEFFYDARGLQVRTRYSTVGVYNATRETADYAAGATQSYNDRREDAVRPTTHTYYDAFGRAIASRDVGGHYSYKIYDALGRVVYEVDAERQLTAYGYDARGNVIAMTRFSARVVDDSAASTDADKSVLQGFESAGFNDADPSDAGARANALSAHALIHARANALLATGTDRRVIDTTFDLLDRKTKVELPQVAYLITAEVGSTQGTARPTTEYAYNAFGELTRQRELRDPAAADWIARYFGYDHAGRRVHELDEMGYYTKSQLDGFGRVASRTEYAAVQSITRAGDGTPMFDGFTPSASPPTSSIDTAPANGYDRTLSFTYDKLDRVISEVTGQVLYAEHNTATGQIDLKSGAITSKQTQYDAVGNVIAITDASGATTRTYYDALGRVTAVAEPERISEDPEVKVGLRSTSLAHQILSVVAWQGNTWGAPTSKNKVSVSWNSLEAWGAGNVSVTLHYTYYKHASSTAVQGTPQNPTLFTGTRTVQLSADAGEVGALFEWDASTDFFYKYEKLVSVTQIVVKKDVGGVYYTVHDAPGANYVPRIEVGGLPPSVNQSGTSAVQFQYRAKGTNDGFTAVNLAKLGGHWQAAMPDAAAMPAGDYEYRLYVTDNSAPVNLTAVGGGSDGYLRGDLSVSRPSGGTASLSAKGSVTALTPLTTFQYDAVGNRVASARHAKGTAIASVSTYAAVSASVDDQVTLFSYDAMGRVTAQRDPAGRRLFTSYDAYGKVAKNWRTQSYVTGGSRQVTDLYVYDRVGRQIELTQVVRSHDGLQRLETVRSAFNAYGEQTERVALADGVQIAGLERYAYDAAGRLWQTNAKDGTTRIHQRDLQGNVTRESQLASVEAETVNATPPSRWLNDLSELSAVGRLTTEFVYDELGRVVRKRDPEFVDALPTATLRMTEARVTGFTSQFGQIGTRMIEGFPEPVYGWTYTATLAWDDASMLGTGAYGVHFTYVTSNGSYAHDVTGLSGFYHNGLTVSWTRQSSGAINSIHSVRIEKIVDGAYRNIRYSAAASQQLEVVIPQATGITATSVALKYRAAGSTGAYTTLTMSRVGTTTPVYQASLTSVANGNYEYQILLNDERVGAFTSGDGNGDGVVDTYYAEYQGTFSVSAGLASGFGAKAGTSTVPEARQTLDRWGNVLMLIDAKGNWRLYKYDYRNNQVLEQLSSVQVWGESTTPTTEAPKSYYYYDARGLQLGVKDANGGVRRRFYDAAGQLIYERDAVNLGLVSHVYDALGREVRVRNAKGVLSDYRYDAFDRLVHAETRGYVDGQNRIQQYGYDELGNRWISVNGEGEIARSVYDTRGRLTQALTPLSWATGLTTYGTSYKYDALGNKVEERDGKGNYQTWTYDLFGRLTGHRDLAGSTFTYTYDGYGRLIKQANSQVSQSNGWSNVLTHGQNLSFQYWSNGWLAAVTDNVAKTVMRYRYDALGNRIHEYFAHAPSGTVYQDARISYDKFGRITRVRDAQVLIEYGYDRVGNRRRVKSQFQEKASTTPESWDFWYRYDADNRMLISQGKVNAGGGLFIDSQQGVELSYDAAGNRILSKQYEGGALVYRSHTYDPDNRLANTYYSTTPPNLNGNPPAYGALTSGRTYDRAGRVIQYFDYELNGATLKGRKELAYNANGWLLQQKTFNGSNGLLNTVSYTPNTPADPDAGWYDAAGNPGTFTFNAGSQTNTYTYTYMAFGGGYREARVHGVRSTDNHQGDTTETYDSNGNLVKVTDTFNSVPTRTFAVDVNGIVYRRTDSNNLNQYYFYAKGQPIGTAGALQDDDFDFNYQAVSDKYPSSAPGSYVVQSGDSLPRIALAVYGDSALWFLIADANGLSGDADLRPGMSLNIPNKVTNIRNAADTFKPYNPAEIIGDTTPTIKPPPPPPDPKCGKIGMIISVIVAIVVAVVSWGGATALSAAIIGAAAGAAANATTQAIVLSANGQFSWSSFFRNGGLVVPGLAAEEASDGRFNTSAVFTSAAAGFVSGGVGKLVGGALVDTWSPMAAGAVGGATGAVAANVVSQGLGNLFGDQRGFSWSSLGASAVAGGISGAVSGASLSDKYGAVGGFAAQSVGYAVANAAGQYVQIAIEGHGKIDWAAVAADAFGNALGNSIVGAMNAPSSGAEQQGSGAGLQAASPYEQARNQGMSVEQALAYAAEQTPAGDASYTDYAGDPNATQLDPIEVTGQRVAPMSGFDLLDQRMWDSINRMTASIQFGAALNRDLKSRQAATAARQQYYNDLREYRVYNENWDAYVRQSMLQDPELTRLHGQDFANPANWGKPSLEQLRAAEPLVGFVNAMALSPLLLAGPEMLGVAGLTGRAAYAGVTGFGRGLAGEIANAAYAFRNLAPLDAAALVAGMSPRLAAVGLGGLGAIPGAPMDGTLDATVAGGRAVIRTARELDLTLAGVVPDVLTSSGVPIPLYWNRATTVLGRYGSDLAPLDTKLVIDTMGIPTTSGLVSNVGPRSLNLLNVDPSLVGPTFWRGFNEPFLDAAVTRGDALFMATPPLRGELMNPSALIRVDAAGRSSLTGFGREYLRLRQQGFVYDPVLSEMVRP